MFAACAVVKFFSIVAIQLQFGQSNRSIIAVVAETASRSMIENEVGGGDVREFAT